MFIKKTYRQILVLLITISSIFFFSKSSNATTIDSLLTLLESAESSEELMMLNLEIGMQAKELPYKQQEIYFKDAMKYAREYDEQYSLANTLCETGIFYGRNRVLPSAIEKLKEAYIISLNNDYHDVYLRSTYSLAVFYNLWEQYDISRKYLEELYTNSDTINDLHYIATYYNFLAQFYSIEGKSDSSIYVLSQSLEYSLKAGDTIRSYATYFNNMANIYLEMGQTDSAIYYSETCYELLKDRFDPSLHINMYLTLAEIYLEDNQPEKALIFIEKAESSASEYNAADELMKSNYFHSEYYKKTGQFDSAMYYTELFIEAKDSIYGEKQMRLISDVQYQIDAKYQQEQILRLKQKDLINRIIMFGSLIIFILVLASLLLIYSRTKLKSKLAHEKANALSDKLKYQKRELTNNALFITHQNNTYKTIMAELKGLSGIENDAVKRDVNKIIQRLLSDRDKLEKKEFELKFKKVYEGYYSKLQAQFPELTKKDLDFCTYLRVDMTTKEIASLTGNTIRSVEMTRSRLRKKLNISSEENVTEFLSKF